MKLQAALIFIFVFTIEVRVRAFDFDNDKVVETPDKCLESTGSYCVIKNLDQKFSYNDVDYTMSMSPESIVVRQKAKVLSFVKGQIYLKTDAKITLEIPYGQIEVDENTQVILDKFPDKVQVQTIFGKVFLKPLGEKKPILVIQGQENYLSQVNDTRKALTGIPKPIIISQLLKAWAYHCGLNKEKFLEEVKNFKNIHETAVRELSILNEQIASREIASAKQEKMAQEERDRKAKEQKENLQKTYYNRLLGE